MVCPESNSSEAIRRGLKSLPKQSPPPDLQMRLRVLGSREAARRREAANPWNWLDKYRRWIDSLMRPFAIPTAGGFVSALLLFGALAPTLAIRESASASVSDVPTMLYTDPTVRSYIPLFCEGYDVAVDITVDDQGRPTDYSVSGANSPALLKSIQAHLLTMHFNPATTFGQPTAGRVRVYFRSSRIDVKG